LLGASEAGFFPGIILYLSYWFPARHRAGVTAFFMAAAPISTALGSPLSALILEVNGVAGLAGWQWLFILESIPAVILGVVVFFYMTDRPEKATWLQDDERAWLVHEMGQEAQRQAAGANHGFIRGLADVRVLALALIYFGTSAGLYTMGIWAPRIIHHLGVSSMDVGLLNAIPPAVSVIAMLFWSRHSDRTGERTWHVVIPCLLAAAGLVVAGNAQGVVALIAALSLVNIGISCAKPPLWTLPTTFLSGAAAASGIAVINSMGNLGGFAGPMVIGWLKDATGAYAGGLYFVAALLVVSAVLTWLLARSKSNKPLVNV
jgi:ACS family tartrate transporter-like MFS transporter